MKRLKGIFSKRVGAFSIMELMVVLMIIGIIMSIALPNFQKSLQRAKKIKAKAEIRGIHSAIDNYNFDVGEYPSSLDELVKGRYMPKKMLKDPWNTKYMYDPTRPDEENFRPYSLFSCGPDKKPYTRDDIW